MKITRSIRKPHTWIASAHTQDIIIEKEMRNTGVLNVIVTIVIIIVVIIVYTWVNISYKSIEWKIWALLHKTIRKKNTTYKTNKHFINSFFFLRKCHYNFFGLFSIITKIPCSLFICYIVKQNIVQYVRPPIHPFPLGMFSGPNWKQGC